MKSLVKVTLLVAAFALPAAAQASTFYDWDGTGGVGFLEVGPVPDPANFSPEPLVDFSFQFASAGGTVSLTDLIVPKDPTASAGAIFDFFASESPAFFAATGTAFEFHPVVVFCLPLNTNNFCTGNTPDSDIFGVGSWVLRPPSPAVPEPMSLALFALGLAGLGFHRKVRK